MTTALVAYLLGFGSGAACDRYRFEILGYFADKYERIKSRLK